MTGFELQTSDIGSDCSTSCATTTTLLRQICLFDRIGEPKVQNNEQGLDGDRNRGQLDAPVICVDKQRHQ